MTRATFVRKDGLLCGFTLRGHAGAGVSGTDVVCAAISSAAYLAANTITEICRCPADTEARDGFLRVSVEEPGRLSGYSPGAEAAPRAIAAAISPAVSG